jgi:hypothetical protein
MAMSCKDVQAAKKIDWSSTSFTREVHEEWVVRRRLRDKKRTDAGASGSLKFSADAIRNPRSFAAKLAEPSLSHYLYSRFSSGTQNLLSKPDVSQPEAALRRALADELNQIIKGPSLYDERRFDGVQLSAETRMMLAQKPHGQALVCLNRMLLQDAFPQELREDGQTAEDLAKEYGKIIGQFARYVCLAAVRGGQPKLLAVHRAMSCAIDEIRTGFNLRDATWEEWKEENLIEREMSMTVAELRKDKHSAKSFEFKDDKKLKPGDRVTKKYFLVDASVPGLVWQSDPQAADLVGFGPLANAGSEVEEIPASPKAPQQPKRLRKK